MSIGNERASGSANTMDGVGRDDGLGQPFTLLIPFYSVSPDVELFIRSSGADLGVEITDDDLEESRQAFVRINLHGQVRIDEDTYHGKIRRYWKLSPNLLAVCEV
ncbi:unnamed protein product [Haemonchus placei]|uniref:SHSP domain-containing protein n=1 Tax=Haemonchus placei TaxID=6290 RepID=A0A0N4WGX1_HAEPC|nr:unnamed protein product [Haemonchus placei]